LFDLIEYGAGLHEHATEALILAVSELQRCLEFPVLFAIDEYNELYNYSQTFRNPESKRYESRSMAFIFSFCGSRSL